MEDNEPTTIPLEKIQQRFDDMSGNWNPDLSHIKHDDEPVELTFNTYQELAKKTAIYPGQGELGGIMYNALQICAEAGEVAGKIAKFYRDGYPVIKDIDSSFTMDPDDWIEGIVKEVGDIFWHQAMLLEDMGVKLSDAGVTNLEKLASRKARGVLSGSGDNR